jgi:tRNA nucleotidyltransferase (CCA-adding enzyme)
VPVIKIGTPMQDALRRDLTFNSMFFNINTNQIEDLTEQGLKDLKDGVCRTPLDPLKTFIDDPLRVLRTVRFAQRFGFKISDEIIKAAQDP